MPRKRNSPKLGEVCGYWTITSLVDGKLDKYDNLLVECTCRCGTVSVRPYYWFKRGSSKHCGCSINWRRPNLIGSKFNKLTVTGKFVKQSSGNCLWICVCECGKSSRVATSDLRHGRTKQCRGCGTEAAAKKRCREESGFNKLVLAYKRDAKKRNYSWELSKDVCLSIFRQECYYCGIEPRQVSRHTNNSPIFVYNGIDRINNDLGYIQSNIVACCRRCNSAKSNMTEGEFFEMVARIFKRHLEYLQ